MRKGLATAAEGCAIPLRAFPYPRDDITPPTFCVADVDLKYHQSMGDLNAADFTCVLFVSRASDRSGVEKVDDFMSSGGVLAAIEADTTLGGAASDLLVVGSIGPRAYQVGGTDYYAAEFVVRVWS